MIRANSKNGSTGNYFRLKAQSDFRTSGYHQLKITVLTLILTFSSFLGMTQRHFDPQTLEAIKTKKIAFLTEQVGLTSKEAEKFWPVYNELDKQRFLIMDKKRELELSCENVKPGMPLNQNIVSWLLNLPRSIPKRVN